MTLKLVSNVETLEIANLLDIASCAREFADRIDAGDFGNIRCAIVIMDTDDGMHQVQWGESISMYEALGILDAAKTISFQSNFEE